jgi:hypothetical protein
VQHHLLSVSGDATTRIDVGEFLQPKLQAYRSQFPIQPDMLPEGVFRDLFGAEYFVRVVPPRDLDAGIDIPVRQLPQDCLTGGTNDAEPTNGLSAHQRSGPQRSPLRPETLFVV